MNLDYATLISPYSLHLPRIGHVKSLTLREIWHPSVTYAAYNFYLSLMHLTPKIYYEKISTGNLGWYQSLSDDKKSHLSMIDIISFDKALQEQYCNAFNLFLDEEVLWDEKYQSFANYLYKDEDDKALVGMVNSETYDELCDVILQINGMNNNSEYYDASKAKNKYALKLIQKLKIGQKTKKQKNDPKIELPNIISALSCKHKSINMINIWDLTVYQLYDQFQRQQTNEVYDIKSMSLAAWGDKNNKFDYTDWYKNLK